MQEIFLRVPLMVALACEVREPGDYVAFDLVGRPLIVVRGDDGRIRTLLNICRHRGAKVTDDVCGAARRLTCPYHSWSYDTTGRSVGVPGRNTFGEIDVTGSSNFRPRCAPAPCSPRSTPTVNSISTHGSTASTIRSPRSASTSSTRTVSPTYIDSPNWKLSADGYLDGYHIGYLHRNTIGRKAITNRNTYDFFGPHVRIGFAAKAIEELDVTAPTTPFDRPVSDFMSLVHYVFPNVSLSGGHGDTLMMSRLLPGPTVDRSRTLQFQFYREPIVGDDGGDRRGEAADLRGRRARRGLRHDLPDRRRTAGHRRRPLHLRSQRTGQPAPPPHDRRAHRSSLNAGRWVQPGDPGVTPSMPATGGLSVGGWSVVGDDAVGSGPGGDAVGGHGEGPAAFVHEVMVRSQSGIRLSMSVGPCVSTTIDVMRCARRERHGAVGVGAGAVHRPQRSALRPVGGADRSADVERHTVGAQHDGDDLGVAAQPSHRRHRQGNAVFGFADAVVVQPARRGA